LQAAGIAFGLAFELFETRYVPEDGHPFAPLGYSQVPDEGVVDFQLSHTIVESIHWCSGQSQAQFVHDIGVGLVICKKWNHPQQRLNFFAHPLEFLLFLTQDAAGIFHFTLRNMQHSKV